MEYGVQREWAGKRSLDDRMGDPTFEGRHWPSKPSIQRSHRFASLKHMYQLKLVFLLALSAALAGDMVGCSMARTS